VLTAARRKEWANMAAVCIAQHPRRP
jgi:hypothetical protein